MVKKPFRGIRHLRDSSCFDKVMIHVFETRNMYIKNKNTKIRFM
jgi:hypothetical protein